jgi:GT2 family glycosyltransferase
MPLVSIIIVNWNGAEVLPECLRSLLGLNHKDIEIIVVDNGSADDSVNIVDNICGGRAKVVRLEKNIGFAAGVNTGVENAGGEFIATLNNDMVVEPSWLDQPLSLFKDKSVGIVSCRQMNYYDRSKVDGLYHYIARDFIFMPFASRLTYNEGDSFSKPGYVISANGGSAIIRAGVFRDLGGYDAAFFGYMDETDFCLRAFLRGWRCAYAPNSVVYHIDGFSFKKMGKYMSYLFERNRAWFMYKNIPAWDVIKRLPSMLLMEMRAVKHFTVDLKAPVLYLKARFDGLCGFCRYRKARKENTALFRGKRKEFYGFEKNPKMDIPV